MFQNITYDNKRIFLLHSNNYFLDLIEREREKETERGREKDNRSIDIQWRQGKFTRWVYDMYRR